MIIIKSQSGTELFQTESVILKSNIIEATDGIHERRKYWTVGEYDSDARAKEVFEMIEQYMREQYAFEKSSIAEALTSAAMLLKYSDREAEETLKFNEKTMDIRKIQFMDKAIFVMPDK